MAFLFFGMGKVASTGLPLCLLSQCLELNSRRGEDGQQGIFLCLVIVGVTSNSLVRGKQDSWPVWQVTAGSWGPPVLR